MELIAPPSVPEIERDVLSILCNRPEYIHQVEEVLNGDCFYNVDYRFLFEVVFDIHNSGEVVSQSAILRQVIPSGRKGILETYQGMKAYFTSEKQLVRNAEILVEYSTKRALLSKTIQIYEMIKTGESLEDIEGVVHESESIVISRNSNVDAITMNEGVNGMIDLMHREQTDGITGIPTGLPLLDKITGGWEYDDVIIIAGRPGMGKTACATFHANAAASAGYPVAFISLEVKPEKLVARMISNSSSFSSSDITKGRLADNQKRIVEEKGDEARKLPVYFYDNARSRDVNDISRTMRSWQRKYGLKIIFIDYIGLIKDRTIKDSSNRTAITESVQGKLTELRAQLGIPLVIFSQLNRESESKGDRRPALHNLKNSGKLEEDGTRVIFLFRQDYYDANDAESRGEAFIPTNDMEYIFAKNREGELGPVALKCNIALNRLYEANSSFQDTRAPFEYSRNAALDKAQIPF